MPRPKVLGGNSGVGRSMTTAPSSSHHHHHHHSKSINHNSNNNSNNSNTNRRIVIKPFQKPPTLPVDFYETTSERLLQGTLLAARLGDDNDTKQQQQQKDQQQQRRLASPQTWYSSVVDLVAHQLGPRLYQDLQMTMALATRRVLPDDHPFTTAAAATTSSSSTRGSGVGGNSNGMLMLLDVSSSSAIHHPSLLHYVQTQYQCYLDYVVLCQHVFLPLDQTHLWIPPNHVVKRTSSSSTTTTTTTSASATGVQQQQQQAPSSGGAAAAWSGSSTSWSGKMVTTNSSPTTTPASLSGPPQCLWQVALEQFRCRLETLQLDSVIYQAWWQALRQDWLEGTGLPGGSHNSNTSLLQSTLFMWQDLQVLPQMLQSLQADLEVFFTQLALQHQQQQLSYRPDRFISYVYQKWMHVSYQWTFLPRNWLRTLIEVHLLQPHLTTEWLLHPVHVTMLLEEDELNLTDTTSGINTNNPTEDQPPLSSVSRNASASSSPPPAYWVQLWMLAARLPEGHKVMTAALCNYTKTKGLAIVNNAFTSPAAAKTMIGNLLVLQRRMVRWQQRLLQVTTTSSSSSGTTSQGTSTITSSPSSLDALKHVWEDIINLAHPNNSQIVAECLAKYMDPLLRSTKMELESSNSNSTTTTSTTTSINTAAAIAAASNNDHPTIYQIQQQVLQLFVYLQAKDVFEAFYKKDLAKRLLWNRVVSMDVERHFVTLLKTECGAGYTSKMEGMFADVELSRETMNRYKQQQQAPPPPPPVAAAAVAGATPSVEMEVQVLTTGYWPVYPQLPHLILPESLTAPQEQFASYYRDKYQGRRITWQYALGHVLVRGHYAAIPISAKAMAAAAASSSTSSTSTTTGPRQYEFVVSLCQALVLLQFNNPSSKNATAAAKRWTLPQLQRAIGVEDRDEMERILQSLSLGKDGTRVLRKLDHDAGVPVVVAPAAPVATGGAVSMTQAGSVPPPPPGAAAPPPPLVAASPATGRAKKVRMNVDDQDVFVVDERFRSQQRRIRINNILWKETMEEREKTVESVSRDRLYLIDAVLVRILKARKTITHPQLMQQVMEQVKVPAQASDIKKRIESLIEREYMERDGEDRNRYNYLA